MTRSYSLHDWRDIARILNMTYRFGCSLGKLDARPSGELFETTIEFQGGADALRRLDVQLKKMSEDDKEMAR